MRPRRKTPNQMRHALGSVIYNQLHIAKCCFNTDVAIGVKEKAEFNTAMLSPGEYRIVVMSVPSGERPNSYNYKADFVGSRIIEVKDGGLRKAGDIKLIDRISWRSSSGMAMDFKLVIPPSRL